MSLTSLVASIAEAVKGAPSVSWSDFEDGHGNFNTATDHTIAAAPGAGKAIRWGLLFIVNNGDAAELITLKYGDDAKWTFPIAPGAQGHVWDMRNNPRTLAEDTAVQLASAGTNEVYWYFEWQEVDA